MSTRATTVKKKKEFGATTENAFIVSLVEHIKTFSAGKVPEKIQALKGIEMIAYCGGVTFEQFLIKYPKIFDICLKELQEGSESQLLQLHCAQCLSIFCQGSFGALEAIHKNQVMRRLVSSLPGKQDELRKSILYAIYCLLVKNFERYKSVLNETNVKDAVHYTLQEDWKFWGFNIAQRIEHFMKLCASVESR